MKSAKSHQKYPGAMLDSLFDKLLAEVSELDGLFTDLILIQDNPQSFDDEKQVKAVK